MDLADKTLEEMKRSKVTPSRFTLGALVKLYGRSHRLDLAFAVVSEMKSKHWIVMNLPSTSSLVWSISLAQCRSGQNKAGEGHLTSSTRLHRAGQCSPCLMIVSSACFRPLFFFSDYFH